MLINFIAVVHIIIALVLIMLVLIQDSKGGAMGGLGTGNANSVLGATGATTLAAKMTRWTVIGFAATCITLAIMSSKSKHSVVDSLPSAPKMAGAAAVTPLATPQVSAMPTQSPVATTGPAASSKDESKKK